MVFQLARGFIDFCNGSGNNGDNHTTSPSWLKGSSSNRNIAAQSTPTKPSALATENRFDALVEDLKRTLGPSSGLTSEDVDVDVLMQLMKNYDTADNGWERYAFGDWSRGYTRNLVDEGNGKSNLLVLVWSPGKGSPIHDHGNAHCVMKVLKGNLTETRYSFPESGAEGPEPMKVINEKTYSENSVTYMADELGVHRVWNNGDDLAVSLHFDNRGDDMMEDNCEGAFHKKTNVEEETWLTTIVYTPPNVAKGGCYIFDEKTSRRSHIKNCGYFSAYGKLLKET